MEKGAGGGGGGGGGGEGIRSSIGSMWFRIGKRQ